MEPSESSAPAAPGKLLSRTATAQPWLGGGHSRGLLADCATTERDVVPLNRVQRRHCKWAPGDLHLQHHGRAARAHSQTGDLQRQAKGSASAPVRRSHLQPTPCTAKATPSPNAPGSDPIWPAPAPGAAGLTQRGARDP